MILLLIRHGNATKPPGENHLQLTALGKKEAARSAQAMRDHQIQLEAIWHSSKPRAVATAGILLEKCGNPITRLEEKAQLAPDGDPQTVYDDLLAEKPACVALVSHLPFLERMAYRLQETMGHSLELEFPTAGIQAFRFDQHWEWLWSFDPSENGPR
ncbi:MAG: SixA phosphatase family protein [bacterium]